MIRPSDKGPRSGRSGKRPARTKAPKAPKASGAKAKSGCRRQIVALPVTILALLAAALFRPRTQP